MTNGPVFGVRGTVLDAKGDPISRAEVRLAEVADHEAHVGASFGSYFVVIGDGTGTGVEGARTQTDGQGRFEFASVSVGEWRVIASSGLAEDLAGPPQKGSLRIDVARGDVEGVMIRLDSPFPIQLADEWNVSCVGGRLTCGTSSPPLGTVLPVLVRSLSGYGASIRLGVPKQSYFLVQSIYAGDYHIDLLPPLVNGQWLLGVRQSEIPPVYLDTTSRNIKVESYVGVSTGGDVLLNREHPPELSSEIEATSVLSGTIRGNTHNHGEATVVALPVDYAKSTYGAIVESAPDGFFEIAGLLPGSYYVVAVPNLNEWDLRTFGAISRIVAQGKRVPVAIGEVTEINIEELHSW